MHLRDLLSLPITDPVLIFALVMVLMLISPLLSKRLRLPATVGLILAGMLVGPSVTGLLERDITINLLGTVGLLYLIFTAGVSLDLDQFQRLRGRSMFFGLTSVGIPFALAYAGGNWILGFEMNPILLLGAIVGSHTLLAYPLANKLGIGRNPAVTVTVGGTIVTDFISLMVLGFVIAAVRDPDIDLGFWIVFLGSIAVFMVAAVLVIPRLARWFFQTVTGETEADYVFVLAILFVTAYLAKLAGLAPIIGAFISGLLLNRLVPDTSPLMNRIQFMGNALFIPFFLISVGMLVDVTVMTSLEVWMLALVFIFMVVLGKGGAAWIAGLALRFNFRQIAVMAGLSIPQAAATLAVTLIGFEIGLFDTLIVNAVVIMILVTCLIGPGLVDHYGRRLAIEAQDTVIQTDRMPQRILVPLANPTTAENLMDISFAIRDTRSKEPVFPLTVVRDGPDVQRAVAVSENMLAHSVIYAAGADIPVTPITRVDQNIASGITRAVKERRISTVIIGWNGERTTTDHIFGSVLDQLLDQVRRMLWVCKVETAIGTVRRIHFAIPPFATLEPGFMDVLRSVMTLSSQVGAELTIIGIEERMARIRRCVAATPDAMQCGYLEMARWSDLPAVIDARLTDDDLFILQSAREGTLSWRPGLDRLPGEFTSRYPTRRFIAIYPSETDSSVVPDGATEDHPLHTLVEEASVLFPTKITKFEELAPIVVCELHPREPDAHAAMVQRLILANDAYNSEIAKSVALVDMPDDRLDEPRLVVAICRNAISVPRTTAPVQIMVVVAHPAIEPPAAHLERLNQLARRLRAPGLVDSLLQAKTVDRVIAILRDGIQSG
jgi:Kef-type K+ transport system membrane component KefB/mannitol/fructose-specific phosphotransferase system IIA component (Ntr-type)